MDKGQVATWNPETGNLIRCLIQCQCILFNINSSKTRHSRLSQASERCSCKTPNIPRSFTNNFFRFTSKLYNKSIVTRYSYRLQASEWCFRKTPNVESWLNNDIILYHLQLKIPFLYCITQYTKITAKVAFLIIFILKTMATILKNGPKNWYIDFRTEVFFWKLILHVKIDNLS